MQKKQQTWPDAIYARNARGPPLKLQKITDIRINSKDASNRTIRNRAKIHENFEKRMSCTSFANSDEESITTQRVAQMKRDRTGYCKALKLAKFTVHARFSRKTVLTMKSLMPMTLFKKVKRLFVDEMGFNNMGTEKELYGEMKTLQFEYDGATFIGDSPGNPKVSVIRVADVREVIRETCNELITSGLFEPLTNADEDMLWLHVSGDKGGKSTKLVLQVLNAKNRQSVTSARLLGMFEGDKDSRHNVGIAFGPIFDALQAAAEDIKGLKIQRPVFTATAQPHYEGDYCSFIFNSFIF